MTTTDQGPRKHPSKRQARKQDRKAQFWADRVTAARTPQTRAEVAWDRIRSETYDLPDQLHNAAWQAVERALDDASASIAEIMASAPPRRTNWLGMPGHE